MTSCSPVTQHPAPTPSIQWPGPWPSCAPAGPFLGMSVRYTPLCTFHKHSYKAHLQGSIPRHYFFPPFPLFLKTYFWLHTKNMVRFIHCAGPQFLVCKMGAHRAPTAGAMMVSAVTGPVRAQPVPLCAPCSVTLLVAGALQGCPCFKPMQLAFFRRLRASNRGSVALIL